MIMITHASIDENGRAKNGKGGDQTGKEVCTRSWYSKPWQYVIRFKDPTMRDKVAYCMEKAAKNSHIGYDQNQRNSLTCEALKYGYDPGQVTVDCETDCSALVTLACLYAGVPKKYMIIAGNSLHTRNLRTQLEKTGLVDVYKTSDYTQKTDKLVRGDILLKEGSHVAVVTKTDSVSKVAGTKTIEEVAKEVIQGKWGNMPERKTRIESAGYNYEKVRTEVMRLIRLS
jgi:hypothetical protein